MAPSTPGLLSREPAMIRGSRDMRHGIRFTMPFFVLVLVPMLCVPIESPAGEFATEWPVGFHRPTQGFHEQARANDGDTPSLRHCESFATSKLTLDVAVIGEAEQRFPRCSALLRRRSEPQAYGDQSSSSSLSVLSSRRP